MLHLLACESTAIAAFIAVVLALLYNYDELLGVGANPFSPGLLLSFIALGFMLRSLAGGRLCPDDVLRAADGKRRRGEGKDDDAPPRVVLVTGADGVMGTNLCSGLLSTMNVIVIVCCRTAEKSARESKRLNVIAKARGHYHQTRAKAVFVPNADCESTSIPSINVYVRMLKQFLKDEGLVLDTAVLAVGMISPTLQYVDVSSGTPIADPFDPKNGSGEKHQVGNNNNKAANAAEEGDSICELMLASNSIGPHHLATLLMPLLATGGVGQKEGATNQDNDREAVGTVSQNSDNNSGVADDTARGKKVSVQHPRRLIIVASSAHSHLGVFCSSSGMLLKALHRFGGHFYTKKAKGKGDESSVSGSGFIPPLAPPTPSSLPPPALGLSMARNTFYPDFVKIYGLSKLMNLYTGYTLIELADRQREAAARAKLNSGAGIQAKLDKLPDGDCDVLGGGAKVVKVAMLHPGIFGSGLYRRLLPRPLLALASFVGLLVMKTGKESSQTALLCVLEDWSKLVHGGYYYDCREYGPTSPVTCSLSNAAIDGEERRVAYEWMSSTIMAAMRKSRLSTAGKAQ